MKQMQAVVIGAGPAGYEAALQLGRAGVKTLLIEKNKEQIGGVCLNEGCIPTKNYLQCAEFATKASLFSDYGLQMESKGLDIHRLLNKTQSLKNELRSGVVWLLEQAGVEIFYGSASFIDPYHIDVSGETIGFERCIVATGSQTKEAENLPLDGRRIISSREVFEMQSLPSSITIVGGGPIGCEFATFFSTFGTEVTMIVRGPQLLSKEDEDVSKALLRSFKKRSIQVFTSADILGVQVNNERVELLLKTENEERITCETLLCAIGRVPRTKELKLENAAIRQDEKGFVEVNEAFQTSQKHIYAVGDCIDTPGYAHTAYAEGKIAAHNIITGQTVINTHVSPSAIFSDPQIASCGLNEKEAKKQGYAFDVKKVFFKANAKAKIAGDDSGFIKLIACSQTNEVLGACIVGMQATELIHQLLLAVEKKLTVKELSALIHVHPTLSEIISQL
ncbi:MAG TPA: dihydrolipoyl dehydrogenase [Sulfurovum sp. UBA12169]|nr:MAG TPA: dihydrolipoyl dehydrogenase [Sulfurovum sp. UBA12169]